MVSEADGVLNNNRDNNDDVLRECGSRCVHEVGVDASARAWM